MMANNKEVSPYTILARPFSLLKLIGFDILRDSTVETKIQSWVANLKLTYFGIVFSSVFIGNALQVVLLFKSFEDLNESVKVMLNIVNTSMFSWKMCVIWVERQKILEILRFFDKTEIKSLEPQLQKRVLRRAKAFRIFETIQLCFTSLTILSFGLMPVMRYFLTGGWTLLPWDIWLPIDRFSPKYFFYVYAWIAWMFFHIAIIYFVVDMIILAMIVMVSMEFIILNHDIKYAINDPDLFSNIIQRHNDLIVLVHRLNDLFSSSFMLNFFGSSIIICVSAFLLASSDDLTNLIKYAFLLQLLMGQIFLLCYLGEQLETSSMNIAHSLYSSDWYEISEKKITTGIKLMMVAAKKPCQIAAWKFTSLNYSTFMSVLNATYSYYMLLRSRVSD